MSLINDALKKAQRLRAEQSPDVAPPMPGGTAPAHRITKRGQAMPAQTLILILGGAAVLIVLSAVITVIWLNRTPEPATKPAAPHLAAHPATGEPSPVIVAPVIAAPKPAPESASVAPATPPHEGPATAAVPVAESIPVGATTPPAAPPAATPPPEAPARTAQQIAEELRAREIPAPPPAAHKPAPAKPDPQIQIFVDSVRVAGIRFSGSESKVLMNDRVYRVNDVVDRNLNVRLQQVTADTLTFVDANGITYVKNF